MPDLSVDDLFEALDQGNAPEVATILRTLPGLDATDLLLLADYFQPDADSVVSTPYIVKLVRPNKGRPKQTYADRTRILGTMLGVDQERLQPKVEAEKWAGKRKPRSLAIVDYAARIGRSVSSVKADLSIASRRKKPKK